jgi:zinc/manganese transport system substrate-binding protein
MRFFRRLLLIAALIAPFGAHAALQVVATTQDLAAIATVVGGPHVTVQSLTPGEADPHFADAKPSMIRRVRDADLLLAVGAGLEAGWLPAVLAASRNARVLPGAPGHLDLSTSVILLNKPVGPVTRAMGDVHAQGNPHYWLDPGNGVKIAQAIGQRFSELDPAHAADYRANREQFERALSGHMARWHEALAGLRGRPVIAYHSSFVYLAHAFGFRIVAEVEPKPGIAPNPSHLEALVGRIRAERIPLLIVEPFYERRSAAYLAEHTGIKVAFLPHSVGAQAGIRTYSDLFDAIVASIRSSGAL